jgi:hypothetical protein
MPKYARDSDIDLDEAYGGLIDKHSRIQRNIRTKTWMNSAHHCEDLECGGGAPKTKYILKLHFAFCLAPGVDEDPDSPTCGDVVIHDERFAVISPSGCAEHPYGADFNLDLKDARKGRANYEIRWKKIFDDFKTEHKAEMAQKAAQLEMMQKMVGTTGRQRQTMQTRLENLQHPQRQQVRAAARPEMLLSRRAEPEIAVEKAQVLQTIPSSASPSSLEVVVRHSNTTLSSMEELALHISAVTVREFDSVLAPSWLHNELFVKADPHGTNQAAPCSWATARPRPSDEAQEPAPTSKWLHDELFSNPSIEPEPISGDTTPAAILVTEAPVSRSNAQESTQESAQSQLKRKDAKQAKKQRAMESRALAGTRAEDMAVQEAEEKELTRVMKAQKALARKTSARRGTTPFVRLGR